jgi:hypothetical protein
MHRGVHAQTALDVLQRHPEGVVFEHLVRVVGQTAEPLNAKRLSTVLWWLTQAGLVERRGGVGAGALLARVRPGPLPPRPVTRRRACRARAEYSEATPEWAHRTQPYIHSGGASVSKSTILHERAHHPPPRNSHAPREPGDGRPTPAIATPALRCECGPVR